MKIKYKGPSPSVNVGAYPAQSKGQIVDYPDDVGEELLASAKKQKFICVEEEALSDKTASEKTEKKGK